MKKTSKLSVVIPRDKTDADAKNQVKLPQSVSELTVEAGDQRRKLYLPDPLVGKAVKSAKFQDNYLVVSL